MYIYLFVNLCLRDKLKDRQTNSKRESYIDRYTIVLKRFTAPIPPSFKAFYTDPHTPDPAPNSQSTILIQHTNLPYAITLKISVSSNQSQPSKF